MTTRKPVKGANPETAPYLLLSKLRTLGLTYREYLASDHWRDLRKRYYAKYPRRCNVCSSEVGIQLHHRTYKRLGQEWLMDVVALCDEHHSSYHEDNPEFSNLWGKTKNFIRISKLPSEKERVKAQKRFERRLANQEASKAKLAEKKKAKMERKANRKLGS